MPVSFLLSAMHIKAMLIMSVKQKVLQILSSGSITSKLTIKQLYSLSFLISWALANGTIETIVCVKLLQRKKWQVTYLIKCEI